MMEAPDPKLRGVGIAAPLAWLQETYGPETFLRVLRGFSPEENLPARRQTAQRANALGFGL